MKPRPMKMLKSGLDSFPLGGLAAILSHQCWTLEPLGGRGCTWGRAEAHRRWRQKVRTVIQDSCLRWKEIKVHRVSTLQDEKNHGDGWWWWLHNIIHAFNTTELYICKWLMLVAQFSSVQSLGCVQLFCDPMDCSPPASSVQGILQARILQWLAVCYSRGSSRPRDPTQVSCMADRFFTLWATRDSASG